MPLNAKETDALDRAVESAGGGAETLMKIYLYFCRRLSHSPQDLPFGKVAEDVGVSLSTVRRVAKVLTDNRLLSAATSSHGTRWDLFERPRSGGNSRFVYVIATPDRLSKTGRSAPVKIGRTKDLSHRVSALSTGAPHRLILVGALRFDTPRVSEAVELALHAEFDQHHLNGEWFHLEPDWLWNNVLSQRFPNAVVHKRDKDPCSAQGINSLKIEAINFPAWRERALLTSGEDIQQSVPEAGAGKA